MSKKVTPTQLLEIASNQNRMLKEILELHQPEQIFDDWYCSHCLEADDWEIDQAPYPCPTIQIIYDGMKPR